MALRLDIELGAADAFGGIDTLISSVKALRDDVHALTRAFQSTKPHLSGATDDLDKQSRAARTATSSMERLAEAKKRLHDVESRGGSDTDLFKAKVDVARAQRAFNRDDAMINPKGPNGVADLINTSRVAIGPNGKMQLMPLMNRLMASGGGGMGGMLDLSSLMGGASGGASMLGGAGGGGELMGAAAAGGPVTLALAAAVGSVAALAAAAKMAADNLVAFAQGQIKAGGTAGQTAQLMRIGAALGLDGPSKARQFGETIWHDGIAKGFASNLGIDTRGGVYGNLNDAGKYLTAVRAITDPRRMSDDQATRMGRSMGLEEELLLRKASPGVRDNVLNAMGRQFSPEQIQEATDATVQFNVAMQDTKMMLTELGSEILPSVNAAIKLWKSELEGMMHPDGFTVLDAIIPGASGVARNIFGGGDGQKKATADAHTAALDNHTRSMQDHARALRDNTEVIGGGGNSRGAIPAAGRYMNLDQMMRGAARAGGGGMGSITLN